MNAAHRLVIGSLCVLVTSATVIATHPQIVTAQGATVTVRDAWVRPPLPSKNDTALYMTIENKSTSARSVVSVMAEEAKMAEMHDTMMDGKMMKMTDLKKIDVPASGSVELKPNGKHIMLMDLKTKPAVGDMITGTLKLDDGTMVPFKAEVRK
jgi:copper(I)-binding protein